MTRSFLVVPFCRFCMLGLSKVLRRFVGAVLYHETVELLWLSGVVVLMVLVSPLTWTIGTVMWIDLKASQALGLVPPDTLARLHQEALRESL